MRPIPTIAVALLVAVVAPAPAWAQGSGEAPRPESDRRPFRGIFSGLSSPRTPQSLMLSGSLFGAYDDNVLGGLAESNSRDWRLQRSGSYAGAQAGLSYGFSRVWQRVSVGASAAGTLSYYRNAELSNVAPDYHAGANLGFELTRSTRLHLGHRFAYSRYYRFFTLPVDGEGSPAGAAVEDFDLGLFQLAAIRNSTQVSISQAVGRHAAFSAGYSVGSVDFREDEPSDLSDGQAADRRLRNHRTRSASVGFRYARPFSTHATLNLGYGLRLSDGDQIAGEPHTMHDVNVGVSYARALSFSRRTSLSFSTGSAIAVTDELSEPESHPRTHVRLIGNAALVHELGRTWKARAAYFRGLTFREGFHEPFFTDGVTVGIGGLVTRRLSLSASGAWALSTLNRPGRTGHTAFTANAQSTYALNRYLALFANYVYYQYSFEGDVPLDARFPRALDRQGVRAGLTMAVPLLR